MFIACSRLSSPTAKLRGLQPYKLWEQVPEQVPEQVILQQVPEQIPFRNKFPNKFRSKFGSRFRSLVAASLKFRSAWQI